MDFHTFFLFPLLASVNGWGGKCPVERFGLISVLHGGWRLLASWEYNSSIRVHLILLKGNRPNKSGSRKIALYHVLSYRGQCLKLDTEICCWLFRSTPHGKISWDRCQLQASIEIFSTRHIVLVLVGPCQAQGTSKIVTINNCSKTNCVRITAN